MRVVFRELTLIFSVSVLPGFVSCRGGQNVPYSDPLVMFFFLFSVQKIKNRSCITFGECGIKKRLRVGRSHYQLPQFLHTFRLSEYK